MCALFGSPDRKMFVELANLNSYRGNHSYSVSTTDYEKVVIALKGLGEFQMPFVIGTYYIGHTQAPTTEAKATSSIHPSEIEDTFLWHNGIIKEHQVREWQQRLKQIEPWDTKLLHQLLYYYNPSEVLSEADGSFACVWYDGDNIYLFRNTNCPLFTDGRSYSSTKFAGSESIKEDTMYRLTPKGIEETSITFETKNNFYWSAE